MTRFTSIDQIAGCSDYVRKQLEQYLQDTRASEIHDCGVDIDAVHRKQPRARPEQDAGKMLVDWVDLLVLPDGTKVRDYFAHMPNGGARSAVEGGILQGQGVRSGYPDYVLDLARYPYHGFRLELKAINGDKPDKDQLDYLRRLELAGLKVCVAWGFDEARASITKYLALQPWGESHESGR